MSYFYSVRIPHLEPSEAMNQVRYVYGAGRPVAGPQIQEIRGRPIRRIGYFWANESET